MDYRGTSADDTIDQAVLQLPNDVTIYGEGGNDTIRISDGKAIGGAGNNTLIATGARAVAVYWSSPAGVQVNLATGTASNGYGGTDTLQNFLQVFGSSHNDIITGNAGNNVLVGMGGSDRITGGGGNDEVNYFFTKSTDAKITYDAATDTFTVVKNFANDKGTDVLTGISAIRFMGDGSDNTAVYRSDFTSTNSYSLAGIWNAFPNGEHYSPIGPFHGTLPLSNGRDGMVIGGWTYRGGFGGAGDPATVNAAMLEQQADGSMKIATAKYLPSATTQGIGSVNIADFNGDGKPDIFLAAHNESPFVAVPSVAYLSNAAGTFDKVTLADKVMAHDAQLGYVDGVPTILTRVFQPGYHHPNYQYINGQFVVTQEGGGNGQWASEGMAIAMADFNNDGSEEVIVSDFAWGPGLPRLPGSYWKLAVYNWADLKAATGAPLSLTDTYFTGKPEYAHLPSLSGTNGVAHVPRLWIDDFNHDGLPDVLANTGLWMEGSHDYPSVLQMLQNKGNFQFDDRTDQLNPDVSHAVEEFDYSTQRLDIDNSGILSYISGKEGALLADGSTRAPNYVLVNDGTGRLHVALHDEFTQWSQEVRNFLSRDATVKAGGFYVATDAQRVDKFMPFLAEDGTLNFVAVTDSVLLTNVMAHYDVRTDFTTQITIADRNSSKLMRTFAGNDSVADLHANGATRIDGGLGTDTAHYSGAFGAYNIARQADGTYRVNGGGAGTPAVQDTLTNFERIEFSDTSVALFTGNAHAYTVTRAANGDVKVTSNSGTETLASVERLLFSDGALAFDIAGSAGQAYRVYQAAFNRVPDGGGLGYWMNAMDHGYSLKAVAEGFVNSNEFRTVYGSNPSNQEIVARFYQNVLHRDGEAAGVKYWSDVLDAKLATVAEVLMGFSESQENQVALVGATANGIAYTPFGGG
ncbi:MAG TPA: DUF4214 domain-containing protein [Telluria sp.]|nr:DUF4214 domain-containing protein [Telluria sp.]